MEKKYEIRWMQTVEPKAIFIASILLSLIAMVFSVAWHAKKFTEL